MAYFMPLLKLKRFHFCVSGLRCPAISPDAVSSRLCQAIGYGCSMTVAPKTRPVASCSTGQTREPPFVFASQWLYIEKAQIERPFIFRTDRKKKRKKRKQKSIRVKEKEHDVTHDLIGNIHDNDVVRTAIEIFNAIPQEERNLESGTSLKKKDKSLFIFIDEIRKSKSHILGLPGNEVRSRYEFLCKYGIEKIDSLEIAIGFPSFLSLQDDNVGNLIKLYSTYKIDLPRLFCNFPFVFSLPYNEVLKKLDHLGSIGLKRKDVSALIRINPSFLCFEINDTAKAAIKFSTSSSGLKSLATKSNFIESLLRTAAQEQYHMYEFDGNFASIASFLTELNVPVNDVFLKRPDFFSNSKTKIVGIVHYLSGSPFFFDAEDTGRFIQKFPDTFLQLHDQDVKDQINFVWENLGKDIDFYELLQTSPKMLTESECLRERVELFQKWNFSSGHIGYLMKKFPILFIENRVVENLKDRLHFLLNFGDLSVDDVMKFPFCLQLRIVLLRCKIGFIRSKDPGILKRPGLQEIFMASLDTFIVDICSSSLSEFHDFMKRNFSIAEQEWIQKKGRPRDIKAITESF